MPEAGFIRRCPCSPGIYSRAQGSSTRVTYQLYVGASFNPQQDLTWVRVFPHLYSSTGSANNLQVLAKDRMFGTYNLNVETGVLTVTLDNSKVADDFKFGAAGAAQTCQPQDICKQGPAACVRNPSFPEHALDAALDRVCDFWVTPHYGQSANGVFLSDCPANGCIGFAFTLPSGFQPQSYAMKGLPLAQCYPNQPPWNTRLKAVDFECGSPLAPPGSFCTGQP